MKNKLVSTRISQARYSVYRDRVLAAIGTSKPTLVHRITGKLALAGSARTLADQALAMKEFEEAARLDASFAKSISEIIILAGIRP